MESREILHDILSLATPGGETIFSIFALVLFLWIVRPWSGTNSKGVPRSSVKRMVLYMLPFMAIIFIIQRVLS